MGLRAEVLDQPQTLGGMQAALWERLADAETLLASDRQTGAAYLLGYVAEMAIKVLLFRHLGLANGAQWLLAADGSPPMQGAFGDERRRLLDAGHELPGDWEGGHGLLLFGLVVVKTVGASWGADQKRAYCRQVFAANEQWQFGLRYWPGAAAERDVARLAAAAWWLALR